MKNNTILALILSFSMFAISCNNTGQGTPEGDSTAQERPEVIVPEEEVVTVKASTSNVFASISSDSVMAYNYDGSSGQPIIDDKGKLADKILKRYEMDKDQTMRLTNMICDPLTYGGDTKKCFEPHFGVVFYKEGKPTAFVTVCLECNYLISSIEIPGSRGFTKEGAKQIIDFEQELKIFY